MEVHCTKTLIIIRRYFSQWPFVPFPSVGEHLLKDLVYSFLTYSANHRLQIFKSNDSGINTITLNLLERITRAISTRLAGPLKFSSRRSSRLFNSQTSLATTRTRCAGKYGRLFSHIFYSDLLHGRMNGSILLQDCSLPCAESSGAAWIWEVSSDVVGQHLTLSVCEALRNRHIYQDSHNYNPTQRKGKTGNG